MRGVVLLGLAACSGVPTEPVEIADPLAWGLVGEADDPLADHRPLGAGCPTSTWGEEDGAFEIETGVCSYAAFGQALPAEVPREAVGRFTAGVWHADLDAAAPATAHVALLIDDVVLWEREVAIPGDADAYDIDVPWPGAADEAVVGLHLHNHGSNNWTFADLSWAP